MPRGLFVGLVTLDVVQRVERLPGPNEKVVATTADVAAGGPATNAAVTFAAMAGRATLLTALGEGPVASLVAEDLASHHVDVIDAAGREHPGPAVSSVTVLAATGERSVISRNAEQAAPEVPGDLPGLIAGAHVVLVDGHLPPLAVAATKAAKATGIPVVLDGGSWKPVLADLLSEVDVAVCSADFAVPGRPDVESSAQAMLAAGVAFVACTDGPRPIRWWSDRATGAVEVAVVAAVDTLGAGDAFHGAYAYALATGADPVEALRSAADVAAVRVQHAGPRSWLTDPRLGALTGR